MFGALHIYVLLKIDNIVRKILQEIFVILQIQSSPLNGISVKGITRLME